jgi:hypothetical protein
VEENHVYISFASPAAIFESPLRPVRLSRNTLIVTAMQFPPRAEGALQPFSLTSSPTRPSGKLLDELKRELSPCIAGIKRMLYFSCNHARLPPVIPRPLASNPKKRYKASDVLE